MFSVNRLKSAALDGLGKLFPTAPTAAPTVKTPGFHPGANPSALSHVINTLTPDAAQRPAPVKSAPSKSPGTVFVPASAGVKGDERATQRGVVLAAVNKYYQDKGYDFSRAAIEEAAGQVELDVKNLELTYLRDAKGNMVRDASGKPIMGYYVTLTPEGATTAKNAELTREADDALDAFIPEAKRITEIGTPSVTDKTQMQRFEMLRQAYVKRRGPDAAERLKDSFTSMENMGPLIGGAAVMTTPLAPAVMAVGGYGLTKETIELAGLSDDIGRGLSQAERPSDIEKLTPKLDELVQRTALLTANMAAGAGMAKGAGSVKGGAAGVTTGGPTAVAPVTAGGPPFPVPVTLRAPELPTRPTGGGSRLPNAPDVAPTGLPPVAPERALGLTPAENVGGPAGRPEPMRTSVDGNGQASGLRFKQDYETHVARRDYSVPRKKGIGGAHRLDEFMKAVKSGEVQIVSRTPHPTLKGVEQIEYRMKALDRELKPTGEWQTGKPKEKTVYDPTIIGDEQMMLWGRQAFAEAVAAGRVKPGTREWDGVAPNGIEFHGYVDVKTGVVTSFFPKQPKL
jgi:hypothetical protein